MSTDNIVDSAHEFFIGLGSIFNALHELPDTMPQHARRAARTEYLFGLQNEGAPALISDVFRSVDEALGDVPDSMGSAVIEAAYDALRRRDETDPALIELRRRLGPVQGILDGEDAAQALQEMPFQPPRS